MDGNASVSIGYVVALASSPLRQSQECKLAIPSIYSRYPLLNEKIKRIARNLRTWVDPTITKVRRPAMGLATTEPTICMVY